MKLALAPRPEPAHVQAVAAVTWGRALAAAIPPPSRAATEENPRASGRHVALHSIGAYLAVTALDMRQSAVARALGIHRETVRQMLQVVEDRRDDIAFDAALERATQEMCPA